MQLAQIMKTRRSTRTFSARKVEKEKLEQIVEVGRFAPSGHNRQQRRFTVIENSETLNRLEEAVRAVFAAYDPASEEYHPMERVIQTARAGEYHFSYQAPVLILVSAPKDNPTAMQDCACSMQNMMLMANELDLGSCWINQLYSLRDEPRLKSLFEELGLPKEYTVFASLAVGYANTQDGLPQRTLLPRTGDPVTWIE